jgi:hypothetical protein
MMRLGIVVRQRMAANAPHQPPRPARSAACGCSQPVHSLRSEEAGRPWYCYLKADEQADYVSAEMYSFNPYVEPLIVRLHLTNVFMHPLYIALPSGSAMDPHEIVAYQEISWNEEHQ